MSESVKAFLFKTDGTFERVELKSYKDIAHLIGTDMWTTACRKFNGKHFNIYLDDLGLYREQPVITAVKTNNNERLVGNLLLTLMDGRGEDISLTDDDFKRLEDCIILLNTWDDDHWEQSRVLVYD